MKRIYYYYFVASASLWAQSPTINPFPSREFGQPQLVQTLTSVAPNLVEGRELNGPGAIAFDNSVSPPIMYVADTYNNRVLAFQNPDSLGVCTTSGASTCGFASKLVIGQRDLFSTLPQGPGGGLSAGLTYPSALAVDSSGNLYVADSGNNRILRFPAPFKQTSVLLAVDLVIGQQGPTTGNQPNQGFPAPTNQTLALAISSSLDGRVVTPAGLAFDPSGNLWVSDPGNNRVLRFPNTNGIQTTADRVLGQFDFVTGTLQQPPAGYTLGSQQFPGSLAQPSGLAIDKSGNLYVADAYSRVLYFVNPSSGNGVGASRILGINQQPTQTVPTTPVYPDQYTLGAVNQNSQLVPPLGVFTNGTNVFVCDSPQNRIAIYDLPANWPPATTALPSPPILSVIGQNNLTSGKVNKAQPLADATTLSLPLAGAFLGSELWVVDSNNNRVLAYPPQTGLTYTAATRLVGQLDFIYSAPNLIEGREVFFANSGNGSADVAIDNTTSTPHLYIADSLNNRVLGFKDARTVQATSKADIVIGQPDLFHSGVNYPNGCTVGSGATISCLGQNPGNMGLNEPSGVLVAANGDLYVADTGNGRVLRFPSPFAPGATLQANLVLGQIGFGPPTQNPSQQNMGFPLGLAFSPDATTLYVSDNAYNRVLAFTHATGSDFVNGQLANIVLGQSNFTSTTPAAATSTTPASLSGMNAPAHIAVDTSDRLYVADSGNNRVLIFTNTKLSNNGAAAIFQIPNLNAPQGIAVSPVTGDVWVANTNSGQIIDYPKYETISTNGISITAQLSFSTAVLAVALDGGGNPIAAEAANRVSFFFPLIVHRNIANQNANGIAPGMLTYIGRADGNKFGFANAQAQTLPWPMQMSDVQITVDGTPAPIYAVLDPYIYFEAPMKQAQNSTVDVLVTQVSTGQVLADAAITAVSQNPGFLTANAQGTGQVAAINLADGTVNSQGNPAARGSFISFYLTGQGFVNGAGPDGAAPPNPPVSTALPTVITSYGTLDSTACAAAPGKQCVTFSGLGGGYPGLWQLNLFIPAGQAPGISPIVVTLNDVSSANGPSGHLTTTFYVK